MNDNRRLERIEAKIDDLADEQAKMNVILGQQHISLKEHMKRSDILERQFQPVKKHVAMVEGALKLLGLISVLVGIYIGLRSL